MPACVNPCGEFEAWFGGTLQTRPHCQGHPNTRCQGYAECNRGCYARYYDTLTGNEIFNCIIVYQQPIITPQPTQPPPTPLPTVPVRVPNPNPPTIPVPPNTNLPLPHPLCSANLPSPGQKCNSMVPYHSRCCQPGGAGSARCKYSGINFAGQAEGICCIRNSEFGCNQDSHCCNKDHICSHGMCLEKSLHTNTNPVSDLQPVEVPPITLADLTALGAIPRQTAQTQAPQTQTPIIAPNAPQTQGGAVNANSNLAVAADSLPLDIIGPVSIGDDDGDDDDDDDANGYGKFMSVGLTTSTMIWISFVLLWLSLCSMLYWFRKRPESYIDGIVDETITSDTYEDRLEISTPKFEPIPAEIDDL